MENFPCNKFTVQLSGKPSFRRPFLKLHKIKNSTVLTPMSSLQWKYKQGELHNIDYRYLEYHNSDNTTSKNKLEPFNISVKTGSL